MEYQARVGRTCNEGRRAAFLPDRHWHMLPVVGGRGAHIKRSLFLCNSRQFGELMLPNSAAGLPRDFRGVLGGGSKPSLTLPQIFLI